MYIWTLISFIPNPSVTKNKCLLDPIFFSCDFAILQKLLWTKTYPEPCQVSKMERFANIVQFLKAVNYFRKTLHLRCLSGFWIRLWLMLLRDRQHFFRHHKVKHCVISELACSYPVGIYLFKVNTGNTRIKFFNPQQ